MTASARHRIDTLPLVAGAAVLDLVNTVSWRGDPDRRDDHLQSASDCLTWAWRAGVVTAAERDALRKRLERDPQAAAILISGLVELRDLVADVVLGQWPSSVRDEVRGAVVDALAHGELVDRGDAAPTGETRRSYRWMVTEVDELTPRRRLAVDLQELLTSPSGRIGVCSDTACSWIFLDSSRAQNRRWCSSADCGNRYRVQQHQRRVARSAGQG